MNTHAAEHRAHQLLNAHLSDAQRASLHKRGWYYVTGSSGGVYRVGYSHREPVLALRGDQRNRVSLKGESLWPPPYGDSGKVASFCVLAAATLPPADQLLQFTLHLQADERSFRKIAVRYDLYGMNDRTVAQRWFHPRYTNTDEDTMPTLRYSRHDKSVGAQIIDLLTMLLIMAAIGIGVAALLNVG